MQRESRPVDGLPTKEPPYLGNTMLKLKIAFPISAPAFIGVPWKPRNAGFAEATVE
jgi:hypothetical protein